MRIFACLTLLALLATASSQGFTYTDQTVGSPLESLEGRSAALGGFTTALLNSPAALAWNPSLAAFADRTLTASAGGGLFLQREGRARPTYDTFGSIIYYNEYVLNEHLYGKFFAAWQALIPQKYIPSLAVGLGYFPSTTNDYTYDEEVRGTFSGGGLSDQVLGYNTIETRGGTDIFNLALSAQPVKNLAAGISFSFLTGSINSTKRTTYIHPDSSDQSSGWTQCYDGLPMEINFGLSWRWQQRLVLGLGLQPSFFKHTLKIEDKTTLVTTKPEITPPPILSLGAAYFPVNPLRTMVVFEARAEFWSQYSRSDAEVNLEDIIALGGGVEHRVLPEVPVRIGFRYQPSASNPDLSTTFFTFGTGFDLLRGHSADGSALQLDLSGQLGTRSYYQTDLFPENLFGGTNYLGEDRVQERAFQGMVSVRYTR